MIRILCQLISFAALAATIVPSVLFLIGRWDLHLANLAMHLAMVAWFAVTPLWMGVAKKA